MAYPEVRYVLALCDTLHKCGATFDCFFDASTRYIIQDHRADQLDAFDRITDPALASTHFYVVPSGTQADEYILRQAKNDGSDVISNDKYRDRAKHYRWIWKRRHHFEIKDGHLTLPSLELAIAVLPKAEEYLCYP